MFRSPLGRNLAGRARAARRIVLVVSLFAVAASLPYVNAGAWQQQQEEGSPRRSQPVLKGEANIIKGAEFKPGEVLVRFRTETVAKTAEVSALSLRADEGGDVVVERFGGSEMVRGLRLAKVDPARTLEAVVELANRPDVLYAEPNYIWRATQVAAPPNDPRYTSGEMFGMARINAPGAWNAGVTGSKNVVVGVIDGGVDVNHVDLKDNIWKNPAEFSGIPGVDDDGNGFIDDINGWDFNGDNNSVFDGGEGDAHATHVAGTIGAKGNNGIGVTGVNWDVSIVSIKVLGPENGEVADIINGYNYARKLRESGVNLRVLNNSYGGPGRSLGALDAIRQLNNAGILFVAAAGNGGEDFQGDDNYTFAHFPSNYDLPNVVAVASTSSFDSLSSFSNFGARIVSMGAPGDGILSTTPGNSYSFFSGTSMAAPHVSGAAALLCAARPDIGVAQLRGVLAYTGNRLQQLDGRTTTGRRLNVANALQSALEFDSVAPAPVGNLRVSGVNGRNITVSWTATGDNSNAGTAADYDFFYVNPVTQAKTLLPSSIDPATSGTQQSTLIQLPYRNFNGTIQLRVYDNAGNSSDASTTVSIPGDFRSDPYTVALSAPTTLAPFTGTSLVVGDDKYVSHTLPFAFPFYGENFRFPTISTNGAIYFSVPPRREGGDSDDAGSSISGLQGQKMIAGLWDDIDINRTVRADSGVYVTYSDANRIIFRWQGVTFLTPRRNVNFEIELHSNGTIQMRYGDTPRVFPIVGISNGEPEAYLIPSHTSEFVEPNQPISLTNAQSVTFTPRARSLTIMGRVREGGTGLSGVTMTLSGTHAATTTTNASGDYFFGNLNIGASYVVTPSKPGYTFTPPSASFANNGLEVLTADFNGVNIPAGPNSVGFAQTSQQLSEAAGRVTFTVTRTGDTSGSVTLNYRTTDSDTFTVGCADGSGNQGGAYARCDFATTVGTLSFAPGDISKNITVPLIDDAHVEGAETFQLQLSNAVGSGTTLGAQNVATVTLTDNDAGGAPNPVINSAPFFVHMQYLDFLSREPDTEGFNAWLGVLQRCGNIFTGPAVNTDCDRIAVSRAFFESAEFRLKGFYVFRFYKLAFNRLPQYTEIVSDMSFVAGATEAEVYARRAQLAATFTARPEFQTAYGNLSNAQFVATLLARYGLNSVTTPDPANPDTGAKMTLTGAALTSQLDGNVLTRAQVFRAIADSEQVQTAEFNSAFVAVQYYGYLRRTPEQGGYEANLNALQRGVSPREMVNAFLNSAEYRLRFGQP